MAELDPDLISSIRKRPGMYVGDTGVLGLHHLAYVLLDLSLGAGDESDCSHVAVELSASGALTVEDDGTPVVVDRVIRAARGTVPLEPGPHFDWQAPVVLALSSEYVFETWDGERHARIRGASGRVADIEQDALERTGHFAGLRGTRIQLTPDSSIFEGGRFEAGRILERVRDVAPLFPGKHFEFEMPSGSRKRFRFRGGIADRVLQVAEQQTPLHPTPIHAEATWRDVTVRVALQWTEGDQWFASYANTVTTRKHGSHVEGVFDALCAALQVDRFLPFLRSSLARGLVGIVSCESPVRRLRFKGPTKDLLAIEGLREGVRDVLPEQLARALDHSDLGSLRSELRFRADWSEEHN